MGASGDNSGDVELSADVIGGIGASVIGGGVNGSEENAIEFGDVWDENISVLILDPVDAVGEGDNGHAVRVRIGDDGLTKVLIADALFVIGKDDGVEAVIEAAVNVVEEPVKKNVWVRCIVIEIEPENLVILSNDADFGMSGIIGKD